MPRDGSGIYTLPAGNPVVSGTTIEASWANPTLEDIGDALTASVARNGTAPMTANLPMGGFKATGMANGSAGTDAATVANITAAIDAFIPGLAAQAPVITDLLAISSGGVQKSATVQQVLTLAGAATVPDADETTKGIAELATEAEVLTGTDAERIITPATLRSSGLGVYKAVQSGTTKTIASSDIGQYIHNDSGAITVTTPASSDTTVPFGSRIDFFQSGTGSITFVAGSGVTIVKSASILRQYKAATLVRVTATIWHLIGGVTA